MDTNFQKLCSIHNNNCHTHSFSGNYCVFPGVFTSPNHPGHYPNNFKKTETIQVEQGMVVSLDFTAFNIEYHRTCRYDHLTVMDGDGTTLMEKSCGTSLPANIRSRSNIVKLSFGTDGSVTKSGWSVRWTAVASGECQLHINGFSAVWRFYICMPLMATPFEIFIWPNASDTECHNIHSKSLS